MEKFYMVICIFMTILVLAKSRLAPPASPSPSCSTSMYNMVDCVQFLSNNGSKDGKPSASCCAGLEKVLKSNPDCICEYIKNHAQLGANINVTKAKTLPSACQISAPPISQCDGKRSTSYSNVLIFTRRFCYLFDNNGLLPWQFLRHLASLPVSSVFK